MNMPVINGDTVAIGQITDSEKVIVGASSANTELDENAIYIYICSEESYINQGKDSSVVADSDNGTFWPAKTVFKFHTQSDRNHFAYRQILLPGLAWLAKIS